MALDISSPLPTVGGDSGTWGTKLNTAITEIINEAGKDSDIVTLQSTKANKTNPVLDGIATGTAITTTGEASKIMKLGTNGEVKAQSFQVTALNTVPASPTTPGTAGEVRVTTDGVYVANGTNSWVGGTRTYTKTSVVNSGSGIGVFISLTGSPQFGDLIAYDTTNPTKFCIYKLYKSSSAGTVQYSLVMNNVLAIDAVNSAGAILLNDTSGNIKMSVTTKLISG